MRSIGKYQLNSIFELKESKAKQRLLLLPGITPDGHSDWIEREDFPRYGFNTYSFSRRGTPEHFPQGLLWEIVREGKGHSKVLRVRCIGIDPEQRVHLTHRIRSDIHKTISAQPCIITGSTSSIEVDHRAGNKDHPLHVHTDDVDKQQLEDFMPLHQSLNKIKREACKQCVATGQRPERPPFLGGGPMISGEGCFGCFWMQPELYK